MSFQAKINVIFGISTSNKAGISKIYAEKMGGVIFNSLVFIYLRSDMTEVGSGEVRLG